MKNNSNNKKIIIITILLLIFTTGCGSVKTEREIKKYANKNFGEVEVVNKNEISDKSVIYTLKDVKHNFLYECKSYMEKIDADGTTFFSYPTTECNFDDNYKEYIYNEIKKESIIINNNIDISLTKNNLYYGFNKDFQSFDIYTSNLNDEIIYADILKKIENIDDIDYFDNYSIEIYDSNTKEKIAVITNEEYKLLSSSEENDKWFIEYAKWSFSDGDKSNYDEIEFIRKEENVLIKDRRKIYNGLSRRATSLEIDRLSTDVTTIYYFYDNVEKIEFYIVDYYITGQGCYFNNYSAEIRNDYVKDMCSW